MRLLEVFYSAVACEVGRNPDTNVDSIRPWKSRRVSLFDRSTIWNGFVIADRIRVAGILHGACELLASLDVQFWMTLASRHSIAHVAFGRETTKYFEQGFE